MSQMVHCVRVYLFAMDRLCVGKMRLGGALLKRRAALTVSKIKPNYFRASSLVVWTGKASVHRKITPLDSRHEICSYAVNVFTETRFHHAAGCDLHDFN